ncbi:hypothetical protein [Streptomyces sp. NRRL S-350]|uniref:DUF7739 domain-containing protein n=1 Tax=Streptomyces sp. NRRL S-350 TaxID=1463902 RepID=UPI0004BF8B9F|nr:hypothetical protein [Streptomyces sp. NRRL S-350]
MGLHWGTTTGHVSCTASQAFAEALRSAGIGDSATVKRFLTALEGDWTGDHFFLSAGEAQEIHNTLREVRLGAEWSGLLEELALDAQQAADAGGWRIE